MKIAAPISTPDEIEPIVAAGADEVYFGILQHEWTENFGGVSNNRRAYGNLSDLSALDRAVEIIHNLGKEASLTLNAQHYTPEQIIYLLELAKKFADAGGDAVIVGDVGLLGALVDKDFGFKLHMSSIATCHNSESALFYQELGASRIILPRHLTLDEIKSIVSAVPTIECEAFILNDGCIFDEGMCHTIHLPSQLGGPICMDNYNYEYYRADGNDLSEEEITRLKENEKDYRLWTWYKFSCGFSVTEKGYPYGPCGLCVIPFLSEYGITTIKVAGREAPTYRKVKSVEMARSVLDTMKSGSNKSDTSVFAQGLRNKPNYCASSYMCYYPDILKHLQCLLYG